MTDDLDPSALRRHVSGRWGASLTVLPTTESTMDDASKAATEGAPDGHVLIADQQTQGRGAHGRHWVSPPGTDLYFSIVARPAIAPSSIALVTLATGLGVRDAVESLVEDGVVRVKWPNDIWIGRRKCAGILVESRMVGSSFDALIIGVGLNVNRMSWPRELEGLATSIRAERKDHAPLSRARACGLVLARIEHWVNRLIEHGPVALVDALRPNLALTGEPIRWEEGRGVFEGIDSRGAARVRTPSGILTLHAAHIVPDSGT